MRPPYCRVFVPRGGADARLRERAGPDGFWWGQDQLSQTDEEERHFVLHSDW